VPPLYAAVIYERHKDKWTFYVIPNSTSEPNEKAITIINNDSGNLDNVNEFLHRNLYTEISSITNPNAFLKEKFMDDKLKCPNILGLMFLLDCGTIQLEQARVFAVLFDEFEDEPRPNPNYSFELYTYFQYVPNDSSNKFRLWDSNANSAQPLTTLKKLHVFPGVKNDNDKLHLINEDDVINALDRLAKARGAAKALGFQPNSKLAYEANKVILFKNCNDFTNYFCFDMYCHGALHSLLADINLLKSDKEQKIRQELYKLSENIRLKGLTRSQIIYFTIMEILLQIYAHRGKVALATGTTLAVRHVVKGSKS